MKKPKTPAGVIAFGVIQIVLSSLALIGMLMTLIILLILYNTPVYEEMVSAVTSLYGMSYFYFSSALSIVIGVLGLISGIGVLMLKPWARKLLIGVAVIAIIIGVVNSIIIGITAASMFVFSLIGLIFGLVYYGLIIWYFSQPKVRKVF